MKDKPELAADYYIIPVSREKDGYNVWASKNIRSLEKRILQRIRELYSDNAPLEQLALFYLLNYPVLDEDVALRLWENILLPSGDFYHRDITGGDNPDVRDFVSSVRFHKNIFFEDFCRYKEKLRQKSDISFSKLGNPKKIAKNKRIVWDRHHLIPSSRGNDGFHTGMSNNFLDLPRKFHAAWHALYLNYTPWEILNFQHQIWRSVLKRSVQKSIDSVLNRGHREFFSKEVIKRK